MATYRGWEEDEPRRMGEGFREGRWEERDDPLRARSDDERAHARWLPEHGGAWRGGERDWRGGERDWRGGERDWRGGEREWRGGERVFRPGERGWRGEGHGGEWRGGEWRGGERGGEWRGPERGRRWGAARQEMGGLLDVEDRGPIDWLGERARQATRGRGPKGYRRADERIHDEICERIARSGVDASEVEVKVENGEVTLSGSVATRAEKWWLEDLADDTFGVDDVHNNVRVARAGDGERPASPRH